MLLTSNNSLDERAKYIRRCCEEKGVPYMCTGLCNIKIKGSVSSTIVLSKHDEYECDEYNADIEKCIEDGMRPKGKVMIYIRYSYSNVIKFKHKQSHLFVFLVNCKWGEWSIGSCHPTGNEGLRIKTRTKVVVEELGGTCKGTPTELEICNPGKHFLFDLRGRGRIFHSKLS